MKDFFKSFQRSFRRKKKMEITPPAQRQSARKQSLAVVQVGVVNHAPLVLPTEVRSQTWSGRGGSPPPLRGVRRSGGEERHPGRRFTVTENLESAWSRGVTGGGAGGGARGSGHGKGEKK